MPEVLMPAAQRAAEAAASVQGLAACLAALEREARALDQTLAAHLIAAAVAALTERPEKPE